MANEKARNPLTVLWNVFSTICGIAAFSSMTQNLFSDLLAWEGFIRSIFEGYRAITEPVFNFLFGWFPFPVPLWVGDYLTFSTILLAASIKGRESARLEFERATRPVRIESGITVTITMNKISYIDYFRYFVRLIFWPIYSIMIVSDLISQRDNFEGTIALWICKWLAAVLLGFVILLTINAAL